MLPDPDRRLRVHSLEMDTRWGLKVTDTEVYGGEVQMIGSPHEEAGGGVVKGIIRITDQAEGPWSLAGAVVVVVVSAIATLIGRETSAAGEEEAPTGILGNTGPSDRHPGKENDHHPHSHEHRIRESLATLATGDPGDSLIGKP